MSERLVQLEKMKAELEKKVKQAEREKDDLGGKVRHADKEKMALGQKVKDLFAICRNQKSSIQKKVRQSLHHSFGLS